jgi:hypothetical protein
VRAAQGLDLPNDSRAGKTLHRPASATVSAPFSAPLSFQASRVLAIRINDGLVKLLESWFMLGR